MRIGIAQTSPVFGGIARNTERALDLIGKEQADLWVLPELFASGYQFRDAAELRELSEPVPGGSTTQALVEHARREGCHIVAGLPERDEDKLYNSAVLAGPEGFLASYRKVHLFYEETLWFSAGNRPFAVHGITIGNETVRIGMMICFDHLFPESARSLALLGADIICHPANLVMPDLAQRTMSIRALENGVFTATANRIGEESRTDETLVFTGQSQIVAPYGEVLVRLSVDREEVAVGDIDIARARQKAITKHNDKLGDRRPDLYTLQRSEGGTK